MNNTLWTHFLRTRLSRPTSRRRRVFRWDSTVQALEDRLLLSGTSAIALTLASDSVWLSTEEVMALPTSGAAWNTLVDAAAQDTGTPNLADMASNADVMTLAKALVGVRLGNEQYKTQVRNNVMAAMGTEAGGPQVSVSRGIAPYLFSASLVGLSPEQDATFRTWLRRKLTTDTHGPNPGYTIQTYHEKRPNNHGLMAGASRAAIAVYLGDAAELERTAQVFKGWLGDRASYAGFDYGDLSWQSDPAHPVGINPVGATKNGHNIDGAMPEEMRRGASFQWPPVATSYPWEGLQGAIVTAEILHRAGYASYEWQDRALLRAVTFLYDIGFTPQGDDQWTPWLVDARYGTNFANNANAMPGKLMGWTAWTHQLGTDVPQVSSFSPQSGQAGTEVTFTGRNFTGVSAVRFNNTPSTNVTIVSDTELRAIVPAGATTGPISIVNGNGTTTTATPFTIATAPAISSFSPTSGPPGTEVTLSGSGFGGATAVRFNGVNAASFTVVSAQTLRATVPVGATTGRVSVVTGLGTATSAANYVVTQPDPQSSFLATHDAYTKSSSPANNYGGDTIIRLRSDGPAYNGYLKFTVSGMGGAATSAKVRMFVTDGSNDGGSIYLVSNSLAGSATPWTAQNLNFGNAPAISGSPLSAVGAVADNSFVEFDVTAAITGNGTYSFALKNSSTTSVYYGSTEGGRPPELLVSVGTPNPTTPQINSFSPGSGPAGTLVTINGTGFNGVTGVSFNGVAAASFTIDSDVRLRAVTPAGATTGAIRVTAGTQSSTSADLFQVTPNPGASLTFNPSADAHVKSTSPTTNYGTDPIIRLRSGSPEYRGFMQFTIAGVAASVQSAKLRVFVEDSSDQAGSLFLTSNNFAATTNRWTEQGLTWNNAPAPVGSALPRASAGSATVGAWIEFDVTSTVSGNGILSFVLVPGSSNSLYYSSREGTRPPELIVTTA